MDSMRFFVVFIFDCLIWLSKLERSYYMDKFHLHTQIIIGGNGLDKVIDGLNRVYVITDSFMKESGAVNYVLDKLNRKSIEWHIFSEITPDPDIDMVTIGVNHILDFRPQAVIAFGGGSPIDAAKAIVYFASREYNMRDCPFIAIPTTSGTGTEVSKFSVITDRQKGVKYPLVDDSLMPDYAVLDAELTKSVPPKITAYTGMDVLTHAIEAYVCTEANSFTDAMAEKAVKLVYFNLLTTYNEPDNLKVRQNMHDASCLAGAAFSNAGLGLNHGMAHALGGQAHIPHGCANAILLPYVMSFNAGCVESQLTQTAYKYAELSSDLGLRASSTRQTALNLIRSIKRFAREMKVPKTIKEAGVKQKDFEKMLPIMVQAALEDKCTATNPRQCTAEDIKKIYIEAYEG